MFGNMMPSMQYIAIRWPSSKSILKKYVLSNQIKPDLFKLCVCCLKDLNVQIKHPIIRALKKLCDDCLKNPTCNSYHNSHHFKSVILISSIFAKILKLKDFENLLLILIALTHDFKHQGRRVIKKPYYQEIKTLNYLKPKIFKYFLNFNKWKRIQRIILNTYFPNHPKTANDIVEKIILDVDILVSIMFKRSTGLIFSERLKHEQKFMQCSTILFENFMTLVKQRKLHLELSISSCTK